MPDAPERENERNVFGEKLELCSLDPLTGFYRSGYCAAGPEGEARHLVCVEVTAEFLAFSRSVGNDLSTAIPEFGFKGLVPGDRWCLLAERWAQAEAAGRAPRLVLQATNEKALDVADFTALKRHALDLS